VGKQPFRLILATASFLVLSGAALHGQALAPATLDLAGHDQQAANGMVQIITDKSAPAITIKSAPAIAKEPAQPMTKRPAQLTAKKAAQPTAREPVRAFVGEPVRPLEGAIEKTTATKSKWPFSRFTYKTSEGKSESVPVITQYYPQQLVYPYAKIDRHIDSRLLRAATIAEERAHAHSRSRCWHYVKEALLAAGVVDSRPKSELARDAAQELVSSYGFKRLPVTDPFAAPLGSVLVYGTARSVGHVELRTRDGFVSDFRSKTPSRRPLLGVYVKL
jgi:hypothetical protein